MTKPTELFLLGAMRSGTTYLRNVVGSNPSVMTLGSEMNNFWTETANAPCGKVAHCLPRKAKDATPELIERVRQEFTGFYKNKNIPSNIVYRCYRKIRYKNESLIKQGTPFYLLNKSTHLLNKVDFINAIFPHAKYIFIIRDIYSQSNSLNNHLKQYTTQNTIPNYPRKNGECWSFSENNTTTDFSDIPYYWIEQNSIALISLDKLNKEQVLYIDYNMICNELGQSLKKISEFLGITYNIDQISNQAINNTTISPLTSWESQLSSKQKDTIDKTIKNFEDDYKYIMSHL